MHSELDKIKLVPGSCILRDELSSSSISKIYLCDFNEMKAVIRFDHAIASKLAIDRQNEINMLQGITHLDLAPEVLYSDIKAGIMIWKYISGIEPYFVEDNEKPYTLYDLGACLYSLHSFPIPEHSIDIFSNSMALYQGLIDNPSDKLMFNKALSLYNELNKDGASKVLSHNDLHRSNLLWNQKYYFLDWEYSGLNHPCFDIASLVKSFQFNQSQITEFSLGYKGNNGLFSIDILKQWIEFIDYLEEIWRLSVTKILETSKFKDA